MANEEIYRKAIKKLFQKTDCKFEHDEEKAIELFDKLLDRGIKSHCDTIKKLCIETGYDEYGSEEIAKIYDIISLYKLYQTSSIKHWDIDKLLNN